MAIFFALICFFFKRRIKQHEDNYETITDTTLPFVKNMNAGEQFIVNNVIGYLQVESTIQHYSMNTDVSLRTVSHCVLSHESPHSTSYHLFRTGNVTLLIWPLES